MIDTSLGVWGVSVDPVGSFSVIRLSLKTTGTLQTRDESDIWTLNSGLRRSETKSERMCDEDHLESESGASWSPLNWRWMSASRVWHSLSWVWARRWASSGFRVSLSSFRAWSCCPASTKLLSAEIQACKHPTGQLWKVKAAFHCYYWSNMLNKEIQALHVYTRQLLYWMVVELLSQLSNSRIVHSLFF